jgi:hypothetical protein
MEHEPLGEKAFDDAPCDNSSVALEDAIIELYKGWLLQYCS